MTARQWKVEVDSSCIGSGVCLATAPDRFRLVDGWSEPVEQVVPEGDPLVVAAAEVCPVSAIGVRDAETGSELRIIS
ncbi:ferredoxin [Micromonospora inyonensis]|uniref:Ferredoxin n=1 Tax=Micromonospora inyonensis TaxID=47866 RepID=A0A1C6RZK0_9ACTN|nr:ferredoxin [Micromonospora inyonensis]SCL22573.1 ferredoxin [Micromonospora inyonensis]